MYAPNHTLKMREGGITHAAAQVVRYRDHPPADMGPKYERGRQLARMVCSGCRIGQLQGYKGFTPDLEIAGAYDAAELETLLTTGKGKSKPDLSLMALIARESLSKLTASVRKEIIDYLRARANQSGKAP